MSQPEWRASGCEGQHHTSAETLETQQAQQALPDLWRVWLAAGSSEDVLALLTIKPDCAC